jgi:antitoxin component of MazEF toxin-antitoxin module
MIYPFAAAFEMIYPDVITLVITIQEDSWGRTGMVKTLQPIGNSYGIIIDRPILDLLGITATTPLKIEVAPGGKGLLIRPIAEGETAQEIHKTRVKKAAARVTRIHRKTLKKLAE